MKRPWTEEKRTRHRKASEQLGLILRFGRAPYGLLVPDGIPCIYRGCPRCRSLGLTMRDRKAQWEAWLATITPEQIAQRKQDYHEMYTRCNAGGLRHGLCV